MAKHQVQHVLERAGDRGADHVGPWNHHLADQRVAELEDRVDQVLLALLDGLLFGGDLGHRLYLVLGHEGTLRQPLPRHEHVRDRDQEPRNRAHGGGHGHDERGKGKRGSVGVLDGARLRGHFGEHEEQDGHGQCGHDLAEMFQVPAGHHPRQCGAPELSEQGQEEHHVQVGQSLGSPAALLLEPDRPDPSHPADGGLGSGEQGRYEDEDEDERDLPVVDRAPRRGEHHVRRTPE